MNLRLNRFTGILAGMTLAVLGHAQVTQVNLVSDGTIPALHTDPNLVNAWGLDFSPTGPLWVSSNGAGLSTVYKNDGTIVPLVVGITPTGTSPTGVVFNSGEGFVVSNGKASGSAKFVFVTEDGIISGWSPAVDGTHTVVSVDNSKRFANYKGATIGWQGGHEFLYAANFRSGFVEVYNEHWKHTGSFTDWDIPRNYEPFNVKAYGNFLIVTFAKSDATHHDDVPGPGNGFVDVFTMGGLLVERIASHGPLNSPWGIALKIDANGQPGGELLIGNFGDGHINRFDFYSGTWLGPVESGAGGPIEIEGLWALAYRDVTDVVTGVTTPTLYFTAGPGDESHGLLGELVPSTGPGIRQRP